jgi:thiosulfate dehydrogenase [quinone] large subunit
VLLALYYLAAPPLVGYEYAMPTEGSYLIVNKILVELAALVVMLAYPTGASWGVDRFLHRAGGSGQPLARARVEGEVV